MLSQIAVSIKSKDEKKIEDMTQDEIAAIKKREETAAKRAANKLAYINALKEENDKIEKERREAKEAMKDNKDATLNIMLAEYKYC